MALNLGSIIELRELSFEYRQAYFEYDKGSNQRVRDSGERKVGSLLHKADYLLSNNTEVYELITGEDNTNYGRSINYDELMQPWHFGSEIGDVLQIIQNKINTLN